MKHLVIDLDNTLVDTSAVRVYRENPHGREFAIKNICNETGLRHLRVRHYGKEARIEVPKENFKDILGNIEKIRTELVAAGFKNVTLDLEGFKSGKLNKGLNEGRKGTK